jgi:hypothetical protein
MRFRRFFETGALCVLSLWTAVGHAAGADLSLGRQIILDWGLQIQSLGFIDSTPAAPSSYST